MIEQLGAFARPVTKWGNDQQLKLMATAGLHSAQRPKRLDSELTAPFAQLGLDLLEFDRRIF